MKNKIMIIGAGGHGKVVAEIAKKNGYEVIDFLDDDQKKKQCGNYNILGPVRDAFLYQDRDFFVAIGDSTIRKKITEFLLTNKLSITTLIHPKAELSENIAIGEGTVVMAGVVINSSTKIGKGCIVNTSSSIDHDCFVSDYTHISVGVHIAGNVYVGSEVLVGIGATIINNIKIINKTTIGAGAVVVNDLLESAIYVGVPAKKKQSEIR